MAPGGVETSVFHNTIVPESAEVDFSFDTPGMRIFKLILLPNIHLGRRQRHCMNEVQSYATTGTAI